MSTKQNAPAKKAPAKKPVPKKPTTPELSPGGTALLAATKKLAGNAAQ